tara:strand:- start:736 stop:957 length:222 start_codon:yes stop_codon:yes gene_type:complete
MPMRIIRSLNAVKRAIFVEDTEEEEEEGGEYLFDPEAGRASDDPFAHLKLEDSPSQEALSGEEVSKYVTGEQE